MRLDTYLVENDFIVSRNKAQEMIQNSFVSVNGKTCFKNSLFIDDGDKVCVLKHTKYVSRSAYKLIYFLEELDLDISNLSCIDIGSSTGGFTQVLLEKGALEITCVDVGKEQLHKSIKENKRVFSYENCDIRDFKSEKTFDLLVIDVSFISLLNIIEDINRLSSKNIILLFKPQFEVGKDVKRDNNGVVIDKRATQNAMRKFEEKCLNLEWNLVLKSEAKLKGKEGNIEQCYYYEK